MMMQRLSSTSLSFVRRGVTGLLLRPTSLRVASFSTSAANGGIALEKYGDDKYTALDISSPSDNVLHVALNRPDVLNAFNEALWDETRAVFEQVGTAYTTYLSLRIDSYLYMLNSQLHPAIHPVGVGVCLRPTWTQL